MILALTTWYLRTGDPAARRVADAHVAALKRIAVEEREVWYYPASEYTCRGWASATMAKLRLAPDPASFCGRLIMPLLKYHEPTGNAGAFELCRFFANLIVGRSGVFHEDGSFDWALGRCTGFGWTPGDLREQRYEHETCSLVDAIGIGVVLARAGWPAYWGVVERFVRNHLAASQLLSPDWVESAPDRSRDVPGWVTYVDVGERVRGAFAGYGAPNDYACDVGLGRGHTNDVQACCVARGRCSPRGATASPRPGAWSA